mgnify:CR=1 FL=1
MDISFFIMSYVQWLFEGLDYDQDKPVSSISHHHNLLLHGNLLFKSDLYRCKQHRSQPLCCPSQITGPEDRCRLTKVWPPERRLCLCGQPQRRKFFFLVSKCLILSHSRTLKLTIQDLLHADLSWNHSRGRNIHWCKPSIHGI